jgi:hypothetical protein
MKESKARKLKGREGKYGTYKLPMSLHQKM